MRRLVAACLAFAAAVVTPAAQGPPADLIVHNARIYTVDDARPRAEAIAARGERIVAIGSSGDVLALRGPETRVIDAGGAAVVPGLHDAHGHFVGLGASLQNLPLTGTTSWEQVVSLVRQAAARARAGEWIQGRGWDQNDWAEKDFPAHELLSAAAPANPVFLTRVDGHAAVVNRAALDAARVTRDTKDPDGGRIIRDAAGEPTGTLIDAAMGLVSRRIPAVSPRQLEEQILLADAEARRLGLTMVHDAGTDGRTVDVYRRLIEAGRLQTRLYVMLRGSLVALRPHFARGPVIDPRHRLTMRAIKISADGALGSRGAALLEPYADEPGNRGLLTTPPGDVYAQTLEASKAGFQTCIHAIGDRANRLVMDVFERVQNEVPGARDLRLRNEHAQILDAAEIPRFARLNVIASMQATHATSDMPWVPARIGAQRTAEGAYVWQRLLQSGATIANGSDFPVESANPMLGFYAAITRQDAAGQPPGGWMPAERLTRDQALKSFTINAAYAAHAEKDLGSLTVGKLADLVILSRDIMQVPPAEILTTAVRATIVAGRVLYEAAQPQAQVQAPAPQFAAPAAVPPLFFREAWRQTGRMDASTEFQPAGGITPNAVVSASLELKVYDPYAPRVREFAKNPPPGSRARDWNGIACIQLSGYNQSPPPEKVVAGQPSDPPNLWTGVCMGGVAATLRDRNHYVDLSSPLAKIRWVTRTSGFHVVRPVLRLADGTYLVGDYGEGQATTNSTLFLETELALASVRWLQLDADRVVTRGTWVEKPDLRRVDEVGFADLLPGSGHGWGGFVNVGRIEVYGTPVKR